jgi:hypothetical protein
MGLLALVEHVADFFEAHDVPATAVYGERARVGQGNGKTGSAVGGRVSFVLAGGSTTGPYRFGPRDGDTEDSTTRAIASLTAEVEAEIWAWDDADPKDDATQYAAWFDLYEWTMNAIRAYAEGNWTAGRVTPAQNPAELRRGMSMLCYFDLPIPVHKRPEAQKVTVGFELTATQTFPKGQDSEGNDNDPAELPAGVYTVAPDP